MAAGKHTGPRREGLEGAAWWFATNGVWTPLRGRHHKTCAPAIIRAHYNRWLNSTERTYGKE